MHASTRLRLAATLAAILLGIASLPTPPAARANGIFGFNQRGVNTNMLSIQSQTAFQWPDEATSKFGEPQSTYTYLAAKGHKLVRIGFNWDVMQRGLTTSNTTAPLEAKYVAKVTAEIAKAKTAGLKVVLVLSNPCRWADRTNDPNWTQPASSQLLCGQGLTDAHAANLWKRVSALYQNESAVAAYDLFNEPSDYQHPTRTDMQDPTEFRARYSAYKSAVNASIAAIRSNGDTKLVWVESLCCSVFHDFASTDPGGPWVVDPLNRVQYSQHMYPDGSPDDTDEFDEDKRDPAYDSEPGKYWSDLGYTTGFLYRLDNFGGWCATFNVKCSIGEVGWPNSVTESATADKWNQLGDEFYYKANYYGLDVLSYGVQTGLPGGLSPYGPAATAWGWQFPAPGITNSYSQAAIIEKPDHLSR